MTDVCNMMVSAAIGARTYGKGGLVETGWTAALPSASLHRFGGGNGPWRAPVMHL